MVIFNFISKHEHLKCIAIDWESNHLSLCFNSISSIDMSHGQGRYQGGQQYPPNMGHQMPPRPYQHHAPMDELAFGMKNMGVSQRPGQPNNGMLMQDVYHPTDTNRAAALSNSTRPVSQMDFLQALGGGFTVGPRVPPSHGINRSPVQNTMASAVAPQLSPNMHAAHMSPQQVPAQQRMPPQQQPPVQQVPPQQSSTNLSVSASEFVPGFRKPEKAIVLYTPENFKKKSRADDEMAINDVSPLIFLMCVMMDKFRSLVNTSPKVS